MGTHLTWFSVEFHETILAIIPSLVSLLKDRNKDVRSATISAFVELAEHGEFDRYLMGTQLT
jgi:HEAT repeat protein